MYKTKNIAFTLIELLIVVGIIAILAAIAVPNFLEAQTRSKIVRVRADFRNLSVAVEAYAVDNNKYPQSGLFQGETALAMYGSNINDPLRLVGNGGVTELTTPVAYFTRYPYDIFQIRAAWTSNATINRETVGVISRPYDFINIANYTKVYGTADPTNIWVITYNQNHTLNYLMQSWGPSGLVWGIAYDPTNGTTSGGMIYRAGPSGQGEIK